MYHGVCSILSSVQVFPDITHLIDIPLCNFRKSSESPIDRNVKDVELIAARLRRLDTFNRLPPSLLRDISNVAYYEDLERGVTILNQNDSGSSWYIVLGGSLEVRLITTNTQTTQTNTIEKASVYLKRYASSRDDICMIRSEESQHI
ncbi:hypothetical protein M8J77_012064 [Diaphorina citri]|nr:hypothetical protein M8J77_012064 [Diaphorina citri]